MAVKEPYKMEILERIKEDPITIYHIGKAWLVNMCDIIFSLLNFLSGFYCFLAFCFVLHVLYCFHFCQ